MGFKADGEGLEYLLEEAYRAYEEDIKQADENIIAYKNAIKAQTQEGLGMYGHLLNEALKIKGQARERLLKVINSLSNRIRTKEFLSKGESEFVGLGTPEATLEYLEKMKKTKRNLQNNEAYDRQDED